MPITQQQAQLFCDTRLRPTCEKVRALFHAYSDMALEFTADYQGFFAPGGVPANSAFADSRADAPHVLTAADVMALMAIFGQVAAIATPANQAQVALGCVQPLNAS